ncbi:MAG: DUF4157 domain-containing protein [Microcystis aeruginosa PMC 728.11]|nr:DUF4157 domain-containing protein [Microcystis aeruginosa PMC 728.11]
MRDRQSTPDTKSQHSQPTKEREAQRATAQEEVLATQQDPLVQTISRIGSAPSAKVHADLLSRATSDYPACGRQLMLQMQRQYGNRYVQRVMELSRQGGGEAEATPEVEAAIEQARGGGRSLDSGIQRQMESAFGTNFSGVRVHTDSTADALNQSLSARAFTTGQDIFFRQGEYNPGSSSGKELLAHELTHVVQQTGTVRGKMAIGQPDDAYEQEADRIASQVVDKINSSSLDQSVQRQCECEGQEKELEGSIMRYGQTVVQQTSPQSNLTKAVQRANTYNDCTVPQRTAIENAYNRAIGKVNASVAALAAAHASHPIIDPHTRTLLNRHFHTNNKDDISKIHNRFLDIQRAFATGINFECETDCKPNVGGYVYYFLFWHVGRVHICFDLFNTSPALIQEAIIIHEVAHRFAGVDDKAYVWQGNYATLTPKQAMDNADSYANFAIEL